MGMNWSGQIFVYPETGGRFHVATTLPIGVMASALIEAYDATGPMIPVGFPETQVVDDPAMWLANKVKEGFSFTPKQM